MNMCCSVHIMISFEIFRTCIMHLLVCMGIHLCILTGMEWSSLAVDKSIFTPGILASENLVDFLYQSDEHQIGSDSPYSLLIPKICCESQGTIIISQLRKPHSLLPSISVRNEVSWGFSMEKLA